MSYVESHSENATEGVVEEEKGARKSRSSVEYFVFLINDTCPHTTSRYGLPTRNVQMPFHLTVVTKDVENKARYAWCCGGLSISVLKCVSASDAYLERIELTIWLSSNVCHSLVHWDDQLVLPS